MLPELDVEYEIEFGDSFRLNSKPLNTLMMKFVPQFAVGDYGVLESNSSLASRDMKIQFQNSSNSNEVVTLIGNGKSTTGNSQSQQLAALLFDPERECFVLERVGAVYHTTRVEEKEKRPSKAYLQLKRDRPYVDEIVARNAKKMKETSNKTNSNAFSANSVSSQESVAKTNLRLEEGSDSSSDENSEEDSFGDLEGKVAGMFGDSNSDDSDDIPATNGSSLLKNNNNGNSNGGTFAGLKKPRVVNMSDSESSSTSSDESSDDS